MKQRVSVKEAAKLLNVSEAAIRQRIQRGSIAHEKDEETNRVYIVLDEVYDRLDNGDTDGEPGYERELIDTLQEQLRLEREASAELRRVIAALTQRLPALEGPPESPGAPVTSSENGGDGRHHAGDPEAYKPSWWRRFFGLE